MGVLRSEEGIEGSYDVVEEGVLEVFGTRSDETYGDLMGIWRVLTVIPVEFQHFCQSGTVLTGVPSIQGTFRQFRSGIYRFDRFETSETSSDTSI